MSELENPSFEEHAESLIKWYREEKLRFSPVTYLNPGTELQRLFKPYKQWDDAKVLIAEANFNLRSLARLHDLVNRWGPNEQMPTLALLILCLKNRSEYASNQSDFYPAYAAVVAFAFTITTISISVVWRVLMGLGLFVILAASFRTRVETRREVAHIKELINLLESYKVEILSKSTD